MVFKKISQDPDCCDLSLETGMSLNWLSDILPYQLVYHLGSVFRHGIRHEIPNVKTNGQEYINFAMLKLIGALTS